MKIALMLMFAMTAGGQIPKPGTNGAGAGDVQGAPKDWPSYITTAPKPGANWDYYLKDGAYHADFIDPDNKWRCYVSSTVTSGPGISSFTVTCVDTKQNPAPVDRSAPPDSREPHGK